jgi:phosphoglycolate phosphatase
MIRLVVFDLDGTLVDSRQDLADAANELIVELGGASLADDAIVRMVGEGAGVLVRRALAAARLDPGTPGALPRFLELYDARLLAHTRPYAGTREALMAIARGRTLSVLTNKPGRATEKLLEGLGLSEWFSGVLGGDGPLARKPDPGGLAHLIDRAGVSAASTLLVGDSAIDLETARRGGVRVCLARYGFGFRFTDADFRGDELFIDAPRDLPPLLESLS